MLRAKSEIGYCFAMSEHCEQCKNDQFNTESFIHWSGIVRFPAKSIPYPDSSGQSELNCALDTYILILNTYTYI